jgi:hypothetical protein
VEEIFGWMSQRSGILDQIGRVSLQCADNIEEDDALHLAGQGKGFWIKCELPDVDYKEKEARDVSVMVEGYHGTSLYSIWRMLMRGVDISFVTKTSKSRKGHVAGFYYHVKAQVSSAGGYMSYIPISNSGYVYGCLVQVRTPSTDPEFRPVSAGANNNRVCQPDCTRISHLHVHVLHVRELFCGSREKQFLVMPSWVPTYELDPQDDLQQIVDRSEKKSESLLMHHYFRPELTPDEMNRY